MEAMVERIDRCVRTRSPVDVTTPAATIIAVRARSMSEAEVMLASCARFNESDASGTRGARVNAVACRRRRLESFGAFPPGTSDLDNQIAPGENARFSGFVKPSYPPMARVQGTKSR